MSNYLKLEIGQSYTLALKYPTPKPARDGFNGEKQVRWTLMDGTALYTPESFAGKVAELRLKPGQRFKLSKVRDGRNVVLQAEPIQSEQTAQPVAQLLNGAESLDAVVPDEPQRIPPTKLEHALKTAVHAAAAAEKHGAQIGYSLRFRPEDIRAMAISVLIGMDRHAA